MANKLDIIYTQVDEAPQLASASLLPIIKAFTEPCGITVGTKNISLAGRIIAAFPDNLTDAQRQPDDLAELGALVKKPEANIIKLPNISASIPQLVAAIKELQGDGYDIPDSPTEPQNDAEREIQARYDAIKGSAVNPVLREGNSDRRPPRAVKEFARRNPHSMGEWSPDSKCHVATMSSGDFADHEESTVISDGQAGAARIEFVAADGTTTLLKEGVELAAQAVVDATFMSKKALRSFLAEQIADAKAQDVLFSLHLKATMMKVSDPVIFGHCVSVYFADLFEKYADTFAELGVNPNNGLGDVEAKIATLPADQKAAIEADIQACYAKQAELYMVNSDKGITNLHVPSDVIIDASMPVIIRNGGKGWGPDGNPKDAKCTIPDHSYAGIYAATVDFCKKNGALDPATMGSVPNVGLMAQKAEEYGSHPTTFVAPGDGKIRMIAANGDLLHMQEVEEGDIWRSCQAKDAPIQDWVKLAVNRARASATPAIFWLDPNRAHDREIIKKVEAYLPNHDTSGLEIKIMPPVEAINYSLERIKRGEDTISVTGNILRDYLTDLFPILEVGTSAKMLSIVPLMAGGGMFETGAGGSAPKHVQQFVQEGHLRWDSLGEFAALAVSLEHLSKTKNNPKAAILGKALDDATTKLLLNNQSPGRKVGQLNNQDSHAHLARYWAEALAAQSEDAELATHFKPIAEKLAANIDRIIEELDVVQGKPVDMGGYYFADPAKVAAAMRASKTLNEIIGE